MSKISDGSQFNIQHASSGDTIVCKWIWAKDTVFTAKIMSLNIYYVALQVENFGPATMENEKLSSLDIGKSIRVNIYASKHGPWAIEVKQEIESTIKRISKSVSCPILPNEDNFHAI